MLLRTLFLLGLWCLSLVADAHIFVYHRFGDDRYPSTNISTQTLRAQFDYLKSNGYEVVPLFQIVEAINSKELLNQKWVAFTIDDNYKSFYENGLEIFKEYGHPFTLFVYAEAAQKKYGDFSDWEELRDIANYGQLAFHSYAHPHMTKMDEKALKEDFERGLKLFQKELGFKPEYFSYPYGEFDKNVQKIANSYGFKAIFNQNTGAISSNSNPMNLDRSALGENSNLKELLSYTHLSADWIEPLHYPESGILESVHVKSSIDSPKAGLYITGLGWREVPVVDGVVNFNINKPLTHERTRLILSVGKRISTHIIIKDN
jgi:peptidoglycan/xylan/chitin deacetylase (PgdA/CDA1 family)